MENRNRLGLPLFDSGRVCPKENCNLRCDEMGDHLISCTSDSSATRRHNAVAATLTSCAKEAGLKVHNERKPFLLNNRKPGDVEIQKFHLRLDTFIDVRISNSLVNLHEASSANFVNGSRAEQEKIRKYANEVEIFNGHFVFQPFVLGTLGEFGQHAVCVIKGIARNFGYTTFLNTSSAARYIRQNPGST